MIQIQTKAPCRIDLFGGTLDMWPLYLWFQPCATSNLAINLFTETVMTYVPQGNLVQFQHTHDGKVETFQSKLPLDVAALPPLFKLSGLALQAMIADQAGTLNIKTASEAPTGSGLAASSAQLISLLGALNQALGRGHTKGHIQRLARDIETQAMGKPAGEQDYFPALYGGLGIIHLGLGSLTHLKMSRLRSLFDEELMVFFTGQPHHSGTTNWGIYQELVEGSPKLHKAFRELASNSMAGVKCIEVEDRDGLKNVISRDWEIRKRTFPGIVTDRIQEAESILQSHGVTSFKVCGAAAGGCLFALVPKKLQTQIGNKMRERSFQHLPAVVCPDGLTISTKSLD